MASKKDHPISALDKLIQKVQAEGRPLGCEDDPAHEKYPNIWEWLTRSDAGRDYIKTPAKLMLTAGPEGWIATVTDPDLALGMEVSSKHLEGVFEALEQAMVHGTGSIKNWSKKQPTLRKRRSSG